MALQLTPPISHLSGLSTASRQLDSKSQTTKQASVPHIATIAPEAAIANEALKAEALRRILGIGAASLAGGAGLAGLVHLLKKFTKPKKPSYRVPFDIDMPIPEKKAEVLPSKVYKALQNLYSLATKHDVLNALYGTVGTLGTKGAIVGADNPQADSKIQGAIEGIKKELPHIPLTLLGSLAGAYAGGRATAGLAGKGALGSGVHNLAKLLGAIGGSFGGYTISKPVVEKLSADKKADWADKLVHKLIPTPYGKPAPQVFSPGWLRGDTMREISSIPWVIPAGFAASIAGLTGGSALVNWLIKKRRKKLLEEELDKAQKEYEAAMLGQYESANENGKKASANRYSLDDIADMLEKRGFFNDLLGKGVGGYSALAALLALMTGIGSYRYFKGRSKDELLEKALKHRAAVRAASYPPDIYIHPVVRTSLPLKTDKGTAEELVTEESRPTL